MNGAIMFSAVRRIPTVVPTRHHVAAMAQRRQSMLMLKCPQQANSSACRKMLSLPYMMTTRMTAGSARRSVISPSSSSYKKKVTSFGKSIQNWVLVPAMLLCIGEISLPFQVPFWLYYYWTEPVLRRFDGQHTSKDDKDNGDGTENDSKDNGGTKHGERPWWILSGAVHQTLVAWILCKGVHPGALRLRLSQRNRIVSTRGGAVVVVAASLLATVLMDSSLMNNAQILPGFILHADQSSTQGEYWFHTLMTAEKSMTATERFVFEAERVIYTGAIAGIYPLVEEILFRRLILTNLVVRVGSLAGIGLSSLAFGFAHFSFVDALSASSERRPIHIPVTETLFGVLVSIAYLATGRLSVPIAIHSIINANAVAAQAPSALPFNLGLLIPKESETVDA